MIKLHPIPDSDHQCPYCQVRLTVRGWHMPGMRTLADLKCEECGKTFYGDLLAGHGLYYPALLDRDTGLVHDNGGAPWFSDWLRTSYSQRSDMPIPLVAEEFRTIKRPLLLNCLDKLYGHCLLKLLNAQYYLDRHNELDLIVLVPQFLRWLVPQGVAAVWTVDIPLRQGAVWSDALAAHISSQLSSFESAWLSIALAHPHPDDFNIERFSRVSPFDPSEWSIQTRRPSVTFVWRSDRVWADVTALRGTKGILARIKRKLFRIDDGRRPQDEQQRRLITLAGELRKSFPDIDLAVVGLGIDTELPDWITDLRTTTMTTDIERNWCTRYANSHVVIGVHGSNMLLPSAHAGSVIELVPSDRWSNLVQDILVSTGDIREAMFRYRFIPLSSTTTDLAAMVSHLFLNTPDALPLLQKNGCDHDTSPNHLLALRERYRRRAKATG